MRNGYTKIFTPRLWWSRTSKTSQNLKSFIFFKTFAKNHSKSLFQAPGTPPDTSEPPKYFVYTYSDLKRLKFRSFLSKVLEKVENKFFKSIAKSANFTYCKKLCLENLMVKITWLCSQTFFFQTLTKLFSKMVEISTFLGQNKCKKNISDVLKSLVTSPGLENAILNEFSLKF